MQSFYIAKGGDEKVDAAALMLPQFESELWFHGASGVSVNGGHTFCYLLVS